MKVLAESKKCCTFAPQSRNNAPNQGAEMIAQEKRRSLKDLHRDRKECSTREKNVPFNSILSLSGQNRDSNYI